MARGTGSCEHLEAKLGKSLRNCRYVLLVEVINRNQHGSAFWERVVSSKLRLCERASKSLGDAHDFPGASHFWSKYGVELPELVERKDGLLYRDVWRYDLLSESERLQ